MKEVSLSGWDDFEGEISSLFRDLDQKRTLSPTYVSPPLFRGHGCASWKLDTTLERYSGKTWSIREYYQKVIDVKPSIESLTGQTWNLPDIYKRDESSVCAPGPPPGYELMIYLRHHEFPSPLLDWTRSPYVAAFFAFRSKGARESSNVAIYSYVEHYGSGKGGLASKPRIVSLGPHVVAHRRHYSQQSEYTICEKKERKQYIYWNHEDVFVEGNQEQDLITKFIVPRSDRANVMRVLELMNVTSYSLFGNEESLMETLAHREIERRER